MPQMAPLLWLNLFFMFLISFTIFFIITFYHSTPSKIDQMPNIHNQVEKPWSW